MYPYKLGAALILSTASLYCQAAELVVHVDHVADARGFVRVVVHRTEARYLGDDTHGFRLGKVAAHRPGVTLRFDVPAGQYAIKAFHDENDNGKLDRNFFGAPTEAYGISNNARARFSLPPFDQALLEVGGAGTQTQIDLGRH